MVVQEMSLNLSTKRRQVRGTNEYLWFLVARFISLLECISSVCFFFLLRREIVARLLGEVHESTGPDSRLGPPRSRLERSLLKLRLFYLVGRTKLDHVAQNDAWKNVSSASRSLLLRSFIRLIDASKQ